MSNRRPWETMPIIGKIKTIEMRNVDGSLIGESKEYEVVRIIDINKHRGYVTNTSYEPERKNEPLVIIDDLVERFSPNFGLLKELSNKKFPSEKDWEVASEIIIGCRSEEDYKKASKYGEAILTKHIHNENIRMFKKEGTPRGMDYV